MHTPRDVSLPELQKAFRELHEEVNRLRKENADLRERIRQQESK